MFNFENKRKMKKIVLVCIVAIMATAAQAQIYVGGTLGFSSVKAENSDAELKTTTTVSYTHLTLPTTRLRCRSRWSPYH